MARREEGGETTRNTPMPWHVTQKEPKPMQSRLGELSPWPTTEQTRPLRENPPSGRATGGLYDFPITGHDKHGGGGRLRQHKKRAPLHPQSEENYSLFESQTKGSRPMRKKHLVMSKFG